MVRFWALLLFSVSTIASKKALIVGIQEYPKNPMGSWQKTVATNDLSLMRELLLSQGVHREQIQELRDQNATLEGIKTSFERFISSLETGDIAVFYFSGHGQQLQDNNKDEIDGLDEALVPFDAPNVSKYSTFYRGEKHLRDDHLNLYFKRIVEKIGPSGHLLVFFESCFSGTLSRAITQNYLGGSPPLTEEGFVRHQNVDKSPIIELTAETKLVFFSAAAQNQVDAIVRDEKGNGFGMLTYALSKSMGKFKTAFSYANLFKQIRNVYAQKMPAQIPQLEGNTDLTFLGSEIQYGDKEYLEAFFATDTEIYINGGKLSGIYEGTELSFNDVTTNVSMFKAVVKSAANFASMCVLPQNVQVKNIHDYSIKITKAALGDAKFGVFLSDSLQRELPNLETIIKKSRLFRLEKYQENANVSIGVESNEFFIKNATGQPIASIIKSGASEKIIIEKLNIFGRTQLLKEIETQGQSPFAVQVELFPVNEIKATIADTLYKNAFLKNGIMSYTPKDFAILQIKNTGPEDFYFSVLGISSDGSVSCIYPIKDRPASDYFLPKNKTYHSGVLAFSPPFGIETIKIFVSKKVLDLNPIIESTFTKERGNGSLFELMLNDIYSGTREVSSAKFDTQLGAVYNYIFEIKPN